MKYLGELPNAEKCGGFVPIQELTDEQAYEMRTMSAEIIDRIYEETNELAKHTFLYQLNDKQTVLLGAHIVRPLVENIRITDQ